MEYNIPCPFSIYCKNLPSLFIMAALCSMREWAYRRSVTDGFLCPRISESVFTCMPHSRARVAKVCRREWKPLCGICSFFKSSSKLLW